MKIVMINDCAFAAETLLRYMPTNIEKHLITRTRNPLSKTFGIAYQILRAHGDMYQANYLLQDCYIASRLGKKPLVGYAVGSDLRVYLRHWTWGRVVRHNLKDCDRIMVSTPDLINLAKPFRQDVEYLPPPVDPELFYPKPISIHHGKKKVLLASNSSWQGKGTDIAIRALSKLKNEIDASIIAQGPDFYKTLELASSLGLALDVLPKVPHEKMKEYYWNTDIVVDQFRVGCPGTIVVEAIACNRPAVTYVSSAFPQYGELPLKDVDSEDKIVEAVRETFTNANVLRKQREYVTANHEPTAVVKKLMQIYSSLIG